MSACTITALIRAVRECVALWLAAAWRLRRGAVGALVALAVAEGVAVAVLSPLGAAAVNRLVRRAGSVAVANEDLVGFFLSPAGVLVGVVAVTVGVAITGLGRGAALVALLRAEAGGRSSGVASFARVLKRAGAVVGLALRQVVLAGLMLLPFGAVIGVIVWLALRGVDLYWMVNTRPARFWIALACIAPVALAGAWFVGRRVLAWSVSLPLCVLCGRSARSALRESGSALRGRLMGVALARLGWLGASGAFTGAVLVALGLGAERVLAREWGSLTMNALVAALALVAHGAVAFVMTLVAKLGDTAIVMSAWRRHAGGVAPVAVEASEETRTAPSWRRLRLKALAVLGAIGGAGAVLTGGLIATASAPVSIEITAHRGDARSAPENTLASIRAAAEAGADRVELDAMLTGDGAVVVFHDTDLRRIAGDARRIDAMTLDEVRAVDAGSWFGPGFAGERVPTLAEAVDLAATLGIAMNIEVKATGADDESLARQVAMAVRAKKNADAGFDAIVTSLSGRALDAVRRADPGIPVGLIVTASVGDLRRVDADLLSVESGLATRRFIARAQGAGLGVHVWGVHDEELFTRLAFDGAQGVITPDPGALVRRREELQGLSVGERLLLAFRARVAGR